MNKAMKKILTCLMMTIGTSVAWAQFSGQGSGTEKDPYLISNADQLFEVRNDLSASYTLVSDIDLEAWTAEESPTYGWSPIGGDTPFTGVFDGNNKSIKGLYVNRENTDNQGLFGVVGQNATIKNVCLVYPRVTGKDNVGALIGMFRVIDTNAAVTNNSVIGGSLMGNDYVGGLIGHATGEASPNREYGYTKKVYVGISLEGNFSSASVKGSRSVGGLFGVVEAPYSSSGGPWYVVDLWVNASLQRNVFQGRVEGSSSVGGIAGNVPNDAEVPAQISQNVAGGSVHGGAYACGLIGGDGTAADIAKNVCLNKLVVSETEPFRIAAREGSNNIAYNETVMMQNSKLLNVEDNDRNGTGMSLRMLHRQTTYEGIAFDFNKDWNIVEGETMPFNREQSLPGEVHTFIAGSRATMSGISAESMGHVYVFIGETMWEAPVVDGKWELTVGRVEEGEEAKVAFQSGNLQASIFVTAMATSAPVPPATPGDANGDGAVDASDVTAIINYILGRPSASFHKANADVTGDGEILIDDAVNTVQMIMDAQ